MRRPAAMRAVVVRGERRGGMDSWDVDVRCVGGDVRCVGGGVAVDGDVHGVLDTSGVGVDVVQRATCGGSGDTDMVAMLGGGNGVRSMLRRAMSPRRDVPGYVKAKARRRDVSFRADGGMETGK